MPEPDQPAKDEQPASEPEPVISVTIGKVEIRAVSAAAPPARAHREKGMTLEEYLRGRATGGGR